MSALVRQIADIQTKPFPPRPPRGTLPPMSTTTPTQRRERAETLYSRNHGPVICNERPAYVLPARPSGPNAPLAHLSDDEYTLLIDQILEDWDCATLSELGLCRAHHLTLEELDRITDDPAFDRALARIRSIREKRRPEREAAAQARVFDRLLGLLEQPQDTATRAKEVRLTAKQLLTLLAPPSPAPAGEVAERSEAGGGLPTSPGLLF